MKTMVQQKNYGDSLSQGMVKRLFLYHIGNPIKPRYNSLKRTFDVLFRLLGLLVCLPILVLFGILVKLTSEGPVFYRQLRVGYMGRMFYIVKLRSMRNDAEKKTGAVWAQKDDPRITAVGKFMRKTRIDELPQFWNVLRGDMSLVGPRPERPSLTEEFFMEDESFPKRLRVKPGITGYAQVNGGYDISPSEKARLDNIYIENTSIWLELRIVCKTVLIIFTGDGAR